MRRTLWRVLWLVAALVAAFLAARYFFRAEPLEVTVLRAGRGTVEETVTNTRAGTVRARLRTRMSPEIGGRAVEIPHREGERVAAGDVLLRLDDATYRAQVELARRDLAAAGAEKERACLAAERAGRERERLRRLSVEGIVSTDLFDQVGSQAATTAASCEAARAGEARAGAAVQVALAELGKTVLRAPFAGVIADLSIELGEWTTPSPPAMPVPAVIDLIDTRSLYVSAPMDEVDSARIRPGLEARVSVDSHRGRSFAGRVERVAPYVLDVEEQNRTVEIEVELADPTRGEALLPGTSADVEVILTRLENVLRLPASAVLEGDRALVIEGGVVAERRLAVGLRNWDFVQVASGLAEGEEVVTSLDRADVKAGARVRVVPAAEAPPPEPSP